jgi:hypothetical protein
MPLKQAFNSPCASRWGAVGEVPIVISEERAMTRLESVAWTLAGGSMTVLVLSAVLKDQPWMTAFLAIAAAVALWARRAPLVAGMSLGVIGWFFVTGFDVNSEGNLWFAGWVDVVRLAVLVGVAPVAVLVGRLLRVEHAEQYGLEMRAPEDMVWATPHRLMGSGSRSGSLGERVVSSGVSDGDRYCRPAAVVPHMGPRIRGMRNGTAD